MASDVASCVVVKLWVFFGAFPRRCIPPVLVDVHLTISIAIRPPNDSHRIRLWEKQCHVVAGKPAKRLECTATNSLLHSNDVRRIVGVLDGELSNLKLLCICREYACKQSPHHLAIIRRILDIEPTSSS